MSGLSKKLISRSTLTRLSALKPCNSTRINCLSTNTDKCYDVVIVGAGIIGSASARELSRRYPKMSMAILDKEKHVAFHQSGHNSGVIHAGIYYTPGTLKAKLCVEGSQLMYEYCDAHGIPYKKVGKLIVATNELEKKRLADLFERGTKNGVKDMQWLKGGTEIRKIEPHCTGLEAIWSPHTGICDYSQVTRHFVDDFKSNSGEVFLSFELSSMQDSNDSQYPVALISKENARIKAKYVLTCTGLQSDLIAKLTGCKNEPQIIPVRGEYLLLKPEKTHLIKGNIYPVPDPSLPFLGVHFTPKMDGSVIIGPNGVLAFKREGYRWSDLSAKDMSDLLRYKGFWKLSFRFMGYGIDQMVKSFIYRMKIKDFQKYVSEISVADIMTGPTGVRAQALGNDGVFLDDFHFDISKEGFGKRVLHCRNAPSPGATSSLAIAKMIADKFKENFNL